MEKKTNFKNSVSVTSKIPQQFMISSRSPSPTGSIIGAGQTPKPNQVQIDDAIEFKKNSKRKYFRLSPQVSTVVLYGVPIVSLYIESQERLCLAQISNTLLKQFSYNEIHNRRVALGITCVQCTPVQLEILRRANAMPVSSRRCGMITRREAERLCKSFLGDNSPPRLPDDFAFSVHHECAWGCRGSFLPSRYNSSRAKCIKCSYCGLFFSPNKFIFHSHRISTSDKYIQPDAANFNSWRRHLKLSGSPMEKIMFAWEDVKAMFNGGTRKRIISSSSRDPNSSSSSAAAARRPSHLTGESNAGHTQVKKTKETPNLPSSSSSSSTANIHSPQYHPMRPLNFSTNTSSSSNPQLPSPAILNQAAPILHINPPPLRAPHAATSTFPQELPFSLSARSFMIDYMWHQQQQQHSSTSINAPTAANKASNNFQFAPYSALNWIKQPPQSFLFKSNGTEGKLSPSSSFNHFHSAFKPVINNMRLTSDEPSNGASSIIHSNQTVQSPASSTSSNYNNQTANQSDDEHHLITTMKGQAMKCKSRQSKAKEVDYFIDVDDEHRIECENGEGRCGGDEENDDENGNIDNRSRVSSQQQNDEMTSDDENEMVDIETTEDDVQILNLQPYKQKLSDCENKSEEDFAERNNNYHENFDERNTKSPIKSLKEIVNRNETDNEELSQTKRSRLISVAQYDWPQGLNLKKEVSCDFFRYFIAVTDIGMESILIRFESLHG